MILDYFENRKHYLGTHRLFPAAFSYLEKCCEQFPEPGTYEIIGEELFAKIQRYETRKDGFLETHNRYIDIQYMVSGQERVFYRNKKGLTTHEAYNCTDDAQFYEDKDDCMEFSFKSGQFAIFFPEDAHKPAMAFDHKAIAEKIVLKVKL